MCLVSRKSKHEFNTPLNTGIGLLSPNLGFARVPKKISHIFRRLERGGSVKKYRFGAVHHSKSKHQ